MTGPVQRPASNSDARKRAEERSAENDRTLGDVLATFVQAADPELAAHLRDAARKGAGCCDACNGKGGNSDGACSDCLGTGCAHAGPCVISPGSAQS